MSVLNATAKRASVRGFYPKVINGSLRFNDDDSAYLSRTPATAGNRKTWTWSAWVKRGNLIPAWNQYVFFAYSGNNNSGFFRIEFNGANNETIRVRGWDTTYLETNALFRDPSAWYHIVLVLDTTQAQTSTNASDSRVRLYVNGEQITSFSSATMPSQNADLPINNNIGHTLSGSVGYSATAYFDGYLAEVHFTDGTAYDADAFGELKNGVWVAKAPDVTYGTNGFYLPFSGTTGLYSESTGGAFSLTSSNDIQRTQGNDSAALFSGLVTGDFDISFKFSPNSSSLTPGDAFTVGFFPESGYESLNYNSGFAGQSTYWVIQNGSTGAKAINNTDGTTNLSSTTTADVFQLTRTSGTFKIFKNSSLVHTFTTTSTVDGYFFFGSGDKDETITLVDITFNDVNGESSSTPFQSALAIGGDASGRGNHFISYNLEPMDVVADSPTDNFATLNPISRNGANGAAVFSEGNLVVTRASGDNYQAMATIPVTSGKWYVELTGISATSLRGQFGFLVNDKSSNTTSNRAISQDGYAYRAADGQAYAFGVGSSYGATWTDGDVIGLALDADNGSATFYKNGVSQGVAFSGLTADSYLIGTSVEDGGKMQVNFGQLGFTYTPPTGYLALSTANLPDPVIDPAQDASPSDYFNTVLYTGTGSAQSITGVGFQPDWVWIKSRSTTYNNNVFDSVRGVEKYLLTDSTLAENGGTSGVGSLTSFDSDGFSLGTQAYINNNTTTFVAWNWKANGSGVSNTDGSITSTVSANTTSGFSIVSYTGNGTSGQSVGHGLGVKPEFIIVKNRSTTGGWVCWHQGLTGGSEEDRYIYLNLTGASGVTTDYWGSGGITSSTFGVWASGGDNNNSGSTFIAYCFHSVEGFSKFGSYTGNGSADGPFVFTNFRPAFAMIKASSTTGNWEILDTSRSPHNLTNAKLFADLSSAETVADGIDILSNGFKLRSTGAGRNNSGQTYIYMAFAENPFKYSNAR